MTINPVDKKREWKGGEGVTDETISAGDKLGKYVLGGTYIHRYKGGGVDIGEAIESVPSGTPLEEHEHRRWRATREKWEAPPGTKKVTYT